jgi:hypothetical protein
MDNVQKASVSVVVVYVCSLPLTEDADIVKDIQITLYVLQLLSSIVFLLRRASIQTAWNA